MSNSPPCHFRSSRSYPTRSRLSQNEHATKSEHSDIDLRAFGKTSIQSPKLNSDMNRNMSTQTAIYGAIYAHYHDPTAFADFLRVQVHLMIKCTILPTSVCHPKHHPSPITQPLKWRRQNCSQRRRIGRQLHLQRIKTVEMGRMAHMNSIRLLSEGKEGV